MKQILHGLIYFYSIAVGIAYVKRSVFAKFYNYNTFMFCSWYFHTYPNAYGLALEVTR
jgi:hypothetical protein